MISCRINEENLIVSPQENKSKYDEEKEWDAITRVDNIFEKGEEGEEGEEGE